MRKALIPTFLLVVGSLVLGATVLRDPIARAASPFSNVIIGNTAAQPVPVTVAQAAPIVDGGGSTGAAGKTVISVGTQAVTATALSIHMSAGVQDVEIQWTNNPKGKSDPVVFAGPGGAGPADVELALTRPIKFDTINCEAASTADTCSVSWVGDGS